MTLVEVLAYGHHLSSHRGLVDQLLRLVFASAVWHLIGRAPTPVLWLGVAAAGAVIYYRSTRRRTRS